MSTSLPAAVLIAPIRFYQRFISRYTPPSCRYYPCCSSYGITALQVHGAAKGTALTIWRLLRCNPWTTGGVDHVPPRGRWRPRQDETGERDADAASSTDEPAASGSPGPALARRSAATTASPPRTMSSTPGRTAA